MINNFVIKLGIILGSGLHGIIHKFPQKNLILPASQGVHERSVFIAHTSPCDVLVFCGRKHFYEGYDNESITDNIRTAAQYGVKYMMITNAAGGLNNNFQVADLMIINSHINFNRKFKLVKTADIYSAFMSEKIRGACRKAKVKCHDGVYGCVQGPAYETVSEIKMLGKYHVDAVGMSTVPELAASVRYGINVMGVSVITNLLKENSTTLSNHSEVLKAAGSASDSLFRVINILANELN